VVWGGGIAAPERRACERAPVFDLTPDPPVRGSLGADGAAA
jgi:hypothetical protein